MTIKIPSEVLYKHYFAHRLNTLQITTDGTGNNFICLGKATISITYSLPDLVVNYVSPLGGPSEDNTTLTIIGDNFMKDVSIYCYFQDEESSEEFFTKATVVSKNVIKCDAALPMRFMNLNTSTFTVELRSIMYESIFITSTGYAFRFYKHPQITKVMPSSGPLIGNTKIHLYGVLPDFSTYASKYGTVRCMFSSDNEKHITSGIIVKNKTVECHTPSWTTTEKVRVQVSLNAQHYSSEALSFNFVDNSVLPTVTWIAIYIIFGLCVVLAVLVVMVWYRHHPAMDGYEILNVGFVDLDINEIEIGENIGNGAFSSVYKGIWRGALVAVKRFSVEDFSEDTIIEFEKEISIMKSIRAPNIIQFLGGTFNPPDICIITEFMSRGSLHDILHNKMVVLEWSMILQMLEDTARGMTYLHSCNPPIIHRDLKSQNLLVNEFWRVKVSDFGLSTVLDRSTDTMTICGTPYWTAPEVLRSQHYTMKVDVYSFGIIMWECVTRMEPYANIPPFNAINGIVDEGLRPTVPPWLPDSYTGLMVACWQDNPILRPTFNNVLNTINDDLIVHNWIGQPGDRDFRKDQNLVPLSQI